MEEQDNTMSANPDEKSIAPEGWQSAPSLKDLKGDLEGAKPDHDKQVAQINKWLDNLHVRGTAQVKSPAGYSSLVPKLIRKQAEWRYSALSEPFLAADDMFTVAPVTWEDVEGADQNAVILNNQFNTQLNKVKLIDDYVRDAVDKGTVIAKVGWCFAEEDQDFQEPILDFRDNALLAPLHQELANIKATNVTAWEHDVPEELRQAHERTVVLGVPQEPIVLGYETVTRTVTVKNHPTVELVDYNNVTIDPSCGGDYTQAAFVIHSFESSLSELRKDGKYTNLDSINVEGNSPLGAADHEIEGKEPPTFEFTDEPRKRIVVHEYWGFWDYDDSGIAKPIVAAWVGNTLIRLEENPYPDQCIPFVFVPMLPIDDSVYGEPDGALLEDNQKVIGALTRGMIDVMARSANGQMGVRKDALDTTNRIKFQRGLDYEYNQNIDPRVAFHMHTYPEIPQSAPFLLQQQMAEAESMSGVKAFNNGISGEGLGEVVAGIRGALDASSKRETGILRRLAKGMVDIGRKIMSMNAEFLDETEVVRITNNSFVTIRRDDLAGKYDMKLDISSIEEDNIKAQELAFMLQTMGNNIDPALSKIVLRDIAKLRKMPALAHEIEAWEPQPDPMQQQIQALEIQKLQAEIQELHARAAENQTDAQLNVAKISTEQAKARQAASDADLKDLTYVEQESGVTQEREKELMGEQARSNIEYKRAEMALERTAEQQTELRKYLSGGTQTGEE